MPTYAQLQREAAWNAERTEPEMRAAVDQIRIGLGLPWANIGFKGDNLHLNGAHRSQRWIQESQWCTNRTYTVDHNLSWSLRDSIAGIDITPSSNTQMLLICRRLDLAARAGEIEELYEWYGNVDGDQIVDGWNNIENRVARSDSSHLWHLHMTIHRRHLKNVSFWNRLVNILLGRSNTNPEGDSVDLNNPHDNALVFRMESTTAMKDIVEGGLAGAGAGAGGTENKLVKAIRRIETAVTQPQTQVNVDATAVATALAQNEQFLDAIAERSATKFMEKYRAELND